MISIIITAGITFVASNLDDIVILMLFFAGGRDPIKKSSVVLGQFAAMGLITFLSLAGAMGFSLLPQEYLRYLGIVPLSLGLREIYLQRKNEHPSPEAKTSLLGHPILRVAAVTLANGGDNVGIYIPLFAKMGHPASLWIALLFMVLTGVWCLIAILLTDNPTIRKWIEKKHTLLIPAIFILLGLSILLEWI